VAVISRKQIAILAIKTLIAISLSLELV